MEFFDKVLNILPDIFLVVMYLALAAAVVAVVWSKMHTWLRTALVSAGIAIVAAVIIWLLPNFIESENNDAFWNVVADVFLLLVLISLVATIGVVIWSIVRRK